MYPSKAERILSRYRPIAPRPPPLPPSGSFGTTDPSSTCASVDSFTSSAKCKKSRKRKADESPSGKALKAPKSMGSCQSNTGGASSVTQGASDATVPVRDRRSASQISHGSLVMGVENLREMSGGRSTCVVDALARCSDVKLMTGGYGDVAAHLHVVEAGKMPQQPAVYMSSVVDTQQQHQAVSMPQQKLGSGYNCTVGAGSLERVDPGFMERAAAASATVLPDRSVPLSICDVAGGRGIGYGGGGFTEMIRGITRLPTAADVQSLMQARVTAACAGQATTGDSHSSYLRAAPTCNKEMQLRKSDHFGMPPTVSGCIEGDMCISAADPVHGNDTELVTLPLLPNVPSKSSSPAKVPVCDGFLQGEPPIYGVEQLPPHGFSHVAEKPWQQQQQQMPSRFETSVVRDGDGTSTAQFLAHGINYPFFLHPQVSSRLEPTGKAPVQDGGSPLPHTSMLRVAYHGAESGHHRHQYVSSELEPSTPFTAREQSSSHVGAHLEMGVSLLSLQPKSPAGVLRMTSTNTGIIPYGVGMSTSPVMADGAVVDEVYLEQVYGCSTDPVLLLDNTNQVLWFNKSYDKALKSASERLSGSSNPTGPYIDQLGHPTPLCSFIFPTGSSKPAPAARATLWGFLKKLVMQESEAPMQGDHQPGSSRHSSSSSRMGTMVCASGSRPATVTLESITELHMDMPSAVESTEEAEARLGSGSEPTFITDSSNRVRWVNASLKQMLGRANSECPSTSSNGAEVPILGFADAVASTLVVCCAEKIPLSARSFSCRVNLEWMRGSKRRSITVPCDVSRLASTTRFSDVNWAWQFDMANSLCLNVPY